MGKIVSSVLGGGGDAGAAQMSSSNNLMKANVARLEAIDIPTIEAQKIALQNPELVDQLVAEFQQRSQLEDIGQDPRLALANQKVLEQMAGVAETGGDAQAALDWAQARTRGASALQAGMATADQQNQATGTFDSGARMVGQQAAAQQAAQMQSDAALRIAAEKQNARMAGMQQMANQAAQMGQQDLNVKQIAGSANERRLAQAAQAKNAINQFNKQYQINRANQTSANANQQEIYNKGLQQQQFQNQMSKATGVTQQQGQQAANLQAQAAAAQQAQQAQTGALLNLGGTLGAAAIASDERLKKEIKEYNSSDFLDALSPYKYEYKDKKFGDGEHVGVMAQDLEKTAAGAKLVMDTKEGKMVDYSKAGPAILASLAEINKRLKKVEDK